MLLCGLVIVSIRSITDATMPAIVINAVAPPGCTRCGGPSSHPIKTRCAIIEAPATFPPPRGARALAAWIRDWERTAGTS